MNDKATYVWVWDPEGAAVIGAGGIVILLVVWFALRALDRWDDSHRGPLDYP